MVWISRIWIFSSFLNGLDCRFLDSLNEVVSPVDRVVVEVSASALPGFELIPAIWGEFGCT